METNKIEILKDSVFIGGTEYVPKSTIKEAVKSETGLPFVIIRTASAGVHIGYLKSSEDTLAGIKVVFVNSRRLYSWNGALTLSDLATIGTTKPKECKFTVEVLEITIIAIETIHCTIEGFNSLNSIPIWKL